MSDSTSALSTKAPGFSSEQGKVELTLWLGETINNNNKNNIAWPDRRDSVVER